MRIGDPDKGSLKALLLSSHPHPWCFKCMPSEKSHPIGLRIDYSLNTTTSAKHAGPDSAEASSRASCGDIFSSYNLTILSRLRNSLR